MPWRCFLTEPSGSVQRSFRRYSGGSKCDVNPMHYHDASVVTDPEVPEGTFVEGGIIPDEDDQKDPRWPAACVCGYRFHVEDSWQVNVNRLYRGCPDGILRTLRELPIGAMWNAWWLADVADGRYTGPDGKAWCVMMPGGIEWIVYGPSSDGKKWDVQGAPPIITASPSIGIGGLYHGFIKAGIISEDVDGRAYPGVPRTA